MPDSKGKKLADMMFGKPEQKPAGGDYIRPTPQNAALGAAANLLKKAYAPERTQQAQGAAEFLGIPAVARTLERLSYGEPLTTGKGMTLKPKEDTVEALLSVAPLAPATKGMPVGMMFIGPNAKTWDKAAATAFERLEKAGVDPVEIWRQTGTFRGADGILRQEISDVGAQFRNANAIKELAKTKKFQAEALKEQIKGVPGQKDLFPKALTEARRPAREQVKQLKQEADALSLDPSYRGQPAKFVLEHPELYKAYPELADINVTQGGRSGGEGTLAALSGGKGGMEMEVTQRGLRYEPRSSLLHEMQHAVQTLEDMAPGGNTAMAFKDPRAFEILTRMRADAAKPMSLEEYSKHFFGMNPTKNPADADPELLKQGYESYLKGIPAAVKKIDIDLQKQAAMEYYKRLAGEAEARATQFREPMGMGERRQEFPYSSYDVPAEDLIVKDPKNYAEGGKVKGEGAAFGVFPQMKPRRSKQDPEAAKDVPRQLLRGWAAGTLGLPGDIEGLIRMLPGLDETPRLPTSEFYLDYLPGKAEGESGKGAAALGTLFGGLGSTKIARGALEAGKGAQRLAERAAAMPSPTGLAAQRGVVKMPGGNWLTGSVEKGVAPLKANRPNADEELRKARELFTPEYKSGMSPEAVARLENETLPRLEKEVALNKWIDSNLTNYIKKQMATPDDPVRKLAEEGISHRPLTPYSYETAAKAGKKREVAGGGRYGKSQLAKQWEDESDVALNTPTVGQISLPIVVERNPWLKKLDPNERVYAVDNASELGFDHIVDVLRQDLASGRIRPEQLNKVSMEQAVRRTYEYDQEMAKKMAEAKIKATEGMPVYKEYPEGYKWIELKANKDLPPVDDGLGNMSSPGYTQLEDALKYEGETMGHCVGGYCDDVYEGRSRIYSLRDAKGEPHVTVEVGRGRLDPASVREKYPEAYAEYAANRNKYFNNISEYLAKERPDILAEAPQEITQIKGKQNAAPKEEYLPYVQDFVRSGQWSHVGDIRNTGLVRRMDLPQDERHLFPQDSDYITMEELRKLREGKDSGMKRGGKVSFSDNPDTMKLELAGGGAVKALKALVKGEKKAAVPVDIPRVRPTQQDIIEAAERVGRQQLGEHVTNPLTAPANLAGRAVKEAKRLKDLEYKLKPAKPLPKEEVYQPKIGEVNIALPGDQTIADMILESIGDVQIGSLQQGGAKYGLGRLSDPEEYRAFWASNQGAAQNFQNKVDEIARQFDTDQVTAQHLAMGLTSNDFAQHFADANMRAIDYSKMNKRQMEIFDSHIAAGYTKKNPKTGEKEQISFPDWPGISNPEAALEAMKNNSELRKWFNNRMKTQDLTAATNMPDGRAIQWAITEPLIRNSEINLTGMSVGRMKPGAELIPNAPHETYSHDIAGTALGRAPELAPFEISFPDVTSFVREKYRPQDFTGTIQKVFPHQIVDEAYLEDMQKYYEQLRKVRGFKDGGKVKKTKISNNPDTMRLELMRKGQ